MHPFNLHTHELTVSEVHRNLPPSSLYEHAIRHDKDVSIAANGALVAYSGAKTSGKRINLNYTRAIIDAIHSGALAKARSQRDATFGFDVIAECPNVPSEILIPRNAWADQSAYDATARKLAGLFKEKLQDLRSRCQPGGQGRQPSMNRLFQVNSSSQVAHALGMFSLVCMAGMALGMGLCWKAPAGGGEQ